MSAPTATTHPYDHALRLPDGGAAPTKVDWSDRLGEDFDGWESRELVTLQGDAREYRGIADATGYLHRIEVDGEWYDEFELDQALTDADADDDAERTALFEDAREAFHDAQDDSCGGQAEGPLYNEFYVLEGASGPSFAAFDHDTLTEWAKQLDHLPVVAVELGGAYGLALAGGGMDLSWEIAEAHLRLGYRVPSWIDLPEMADGRLRGDTLTEDRAAIVRAVIRDQRARAAAATRSADRLAERYGITETAGGQA